MRQRQEVQEVLPPLRIFPALPTESAVRKLPYRPARSAATQIHGPHDAYNHFRGRREFASEYAPNTTLASKSPRSTTPTALPSLSIARIASKRCSTMV